MPKVKIIAGFAAYTDKNGAERWAQAGDEIDVSQSEADRLAGLGALFDQAAADDAAKAEEDALQAQRDAEDQARADEAERVAGEQAAQAKSEKAASQSKAAQQAAKSG